MSRKIKCLSSIAILLLLMNCTKTEEKKNEDMVPNDTKAEEITDNHGHTHSLGQGDLPIDPVASKVASFSMEGKYEEAIKILIEAKDVPGYQWDKEKIYESLVYLHDKTKQYEKNLDIWRDGHSKGIIFNMNITKPHFKPYLDLEGFSEILDKDNEMKNEVKKIK